MALDQKSIDQLGIDTIRTLAMDAVQHAKSGHPGTPMALAPLAYTLWQETLRFDPADPIWPNRDRFVLSAGHASMLLYSLLHLSRVKSVDERYEVLGTPSVSLDDIKHFRQLDSKTPGHPEYHFTSRRRDHDRAARPGRRDQRRHGDRRAVARRALQSARASTLFDYNVYVSAATATSWRGSRARPASLAGHLKLPICAGSTTTTT